MGKAKVKKVPVSERAILARINRKLAKSEQVVKKCRTDSRWYGECGNYYAIDLRTNCIQAKHIDLEDWAKELDVIEPFEEVSE